jgi:GNAT superfamily N-acetyltransferase
VLERAVGNSLCLGAYQAAGAQVGLARFVSDYATFCDVYVLAAHRGRGLARAMLTMAVAHPRLAGLRRWSLVTRDAHRLYREFGFTPLAHPERCMEYHRPDIYRRGG